MRFLPLFGLAGSMMILALAVPPVTAQGPSSAPRGTVTPPPPAEAAPPALATASPARAPRGATGASQIQGHGQAITAQGNKGTLIRPGGAPGTVFGPNPDIADVQV